MSEWYIKELAKLTGVSVRTLHHYDQIDLLKPSIRLDNGYRVYSERDLMRLQQILALKFLGFKLSHIAKLLGDEEDLVNQLKGQASLLKQRANSLLEASNAIDTIITDYNADESISWQSMIQLIEVYTMKEKIKNPWVANILTTEEIKEYAKFEENLESRFKGDSMKTLEQDWFKLVGEIEGNLQIDPTSDKGKVIAERMMNYVNNLYGKEHAALRSTIWEKGYKEGQTDNQGGLSTEAVAWIDKAMDSYYRGRIYSTLDKIAMDASETNVTEWNNLMEDMFGYEQEPKDGIFAAALEDEKVKPAAKEWIKQQR